MKEEPNIVIIDDLLDKDAFDLNRALIPKSKFLDVKSQNKLYKDIIEVNNDLRIYNKLEKKLNCKIQNKFNFFRAYRDIPKYRHPMWIHSDTLFAEYIAIHFLQSSEFPQDDGVSFWKHKELNIYGINPENIHKYNHINIDKEGMIPDKWEIHKRIEFKENRIVIAPAHTFHSKTSYGNYGKKYSNCRIVQVLFFNVKNTDFS